jgi:predicted amino acid-binding ACT domain protein
LHPQDARFRPLRSNFHIVTMHGKDQPGLVYKLTSCLANFRFNITDLSTHRTSTGSTAGYIVMAEGEMPQKNKIPLLQMSLKKLARSTHTRIEIRPVSSHAL